jgi:hypothetical protein
MYGSHVGTLNVEKLSGALSQLRWTTTGGKGYEWYHAQVNLQSSTSNPTQFAVCYSLLTKNCYLLFFSSRLLLKEYGQQIIVVQSLLMIFFFLMVHVEHQLINVILILMIQSVV